MNETETTIADEMKELLKLLQSHQRPHESILDTAKRLIPKAENKDRFLNMQRRQLDFRK